MGEDVSFNNAEHGADNGAQATAIRADLVERFIAKFIDALIVLAFMAFPTIAGDIAGAVYILISDGLMSGRSIGKRIIGLKTVKQADSAVACDIRSSIVRNAEFAAIIVLYIVLGWIPYLGKAIVFLLAVALAGAEMLLIYTDERSGMRFGDRVADTVVVPLKGRDA
ncbi:MAG: EI24 domain-containing protein [Deltaproteobacteria bacterium]|nr:EI24 domain-containing protein [Deltaproteobacteria bacterium]